MDQNDRKELPTPRDGMQDLLATLAKSPKGYDVEKIKRAYEFAAQMHEGQFRASGEPYISHPVAVAKIAAQMGLDTDSICAALLHDTVEDCGSKVNLDILKKQFGNDVAILVDGLTKLVQIKFADKEEMHVENLRKMFLAMSKDLRVIFIKLCDRLHNMRTLGAKQDEKRRLTALETMHVFAPLAHRLGMQLVKQELENLSLQYLDPIGYDEIKRDIEVKYGKNRYVVERVQRLVGEKLTEAGIHYTLEGRVKSVYSIYKKMYGQNKQFDEIYDFYAIRIIVDTELECYTVLGIIHEMFRSVPGRFKDYISTPKPNMYRSLHTTVIGRDGVPFEVQIRTWEMHRMAEFGLAAHWKYKSGEQGKQEIDEKLGWIAKLLENDDDNRDSDEFLRALKVDLFHDEVFVFTPKGDVISLPQGATVIDFAYAIHTAVGNRMVGAKINGTIVPIDRVPQNGEIVEILTSAASKGPSRDWLKIVTTGEARNKIRQFFKNEQRPENIQVGKTEIDRELHRFGRSFTEAQRQEILGAVAEKSGIPSIDDLYNAIGYGGVTTAKLAPRLRAEFDRVVRPAAEEIQSQFIPPATQGTGDGKSSSSRDVLVDGERGCAIKFAKCCNPLPGDAIIAFITRGFGVSVHKMDCPNVLLNREKPEQADRWVKAEWEQRAVSEQSQDMFEAMVQVLAQDRIALLADVAGTLADMHVSMRNVTTQRKNTGDVVLTISIPCKNTNHLRAIIGRLKAIKGVQDVTRGFA